MLGRELLDGLNIVMARTKLFISYSHRDDRWLERVGLQFSVARRFVEMTFGSCRSGGGPLSRSRQLNRVGIIH